MLRKTIVFSLFFALLLVAFSAYVRLSSMGGFNCPEWGSWAGCYADSQFGQLPPLPSFISIDIADSVRVLQKNSYIYAQGLLVLLTGFALLAGLRQKTARSAVIATSLMLLVVLSGQFIFGAWHDKLKLVPVIVSGQLLLGFLTVWLFFRWYLYTEPGIEKTPQVFGMGNRLLLVMAQCVVLLQVVLGLLTTTNQGGLVCVDFPQCNGAWLPEVDYSRVLYLFDGLHKGYVGILSFDGQVVLNWSHRVGALLGFILLTWVMLNVTSEQYSKQIRKSGVYLSVLLLIEVLLGIFSVKSGLSLALVIGHTVVAALLMLPLIAISFYSRYGLVQDDVAIAHDGGIVAEIPSTLELTLVDIEEAEEVVEERLPVGVTQEDSIYLRLKTQLKKTRSGLSSVLSTLSLTQKAIDDDLLEEIESSLLMADIGIEATTEIIEALTERLEKHQLKDSVALETALKQILLEILQPCSQPLQITGQQKPFVMLVVGINGVGKTTTIGKLAKRLQTQGHSVMLAAGDTFRAAAVEQLQTWGERNNIQVVAQHTGADSASVIYDGVQSAQAKGVDVLIADTAGRLHTKSNLMEELSKIKRIMQKLDVTAPHEVLLVLDAGTGQNALSQTKIFNEAVGLTGLAVTKLDGTAKGGVMFALAQQFGLPIRFIGVGEGIDDLQDFNAHAFVEALQATAQSSAARRSRRVVG